MHGVQHDDLEMAHDGKPGPRPVGWYWQRVCPVSGCDSSDSAGRHSLSIVILKPKAHSCDLPQSEYVQERAGEGEKEQAALAVLYCTLSGVQ